MEAPGIDDVAPATGNDGLEVQSKSDLEGVPLLITSTRNISKGANGPWVKIIATRLDTQEQVAFSGATVVTQQLETAKAAKVLPPEGPGVRAMLLMEHVEQGNDYWRLVSPESVNGGGPAPSGNGGGAPTSNRTAQVKTRMRELGVQPEAVREFVDSLQQGATVDALSDEDFATLMEWFDGQEPPF